MEFYKQSIDLLYQQLETSINGLSHEEAQKRILSNGANEINSEIKINYFRIFIEQFKSFIIYILFFAVLLSILSGEVTEALLILVILIANALIGYFQEINAYKSIDALKKFNTIQTKVYRDGNLSNEDARNLVSGDVVFLEAGDKVPADCRLIEASKLNVEESSLTGESLPVGKSLDIIEESVQIGEQKNMLFSATTVLEGSAKALVVSTGMNTEIGKITSLIKNVEKHQTPLQIRLDVFGRQISVIILIICAMILLVAGYYDIQANGVRWAAFFNFFFIAISLAVAAVPEGLPAVVTITLSIGVKKMLQNKVLVRTLASVETLGSCDVICTDKTGTLTQNAMTVKKAWVHGQETEISGVGYHPEGEILTKNIPNLLFEIGFYCNNANLYEQDDEWKFSGDPTEAALLVSAKKAQVADNQCTRISEIPFDSERKKMSVLIQKADKQYLYCKGALDKVLESCPYILLNEEVVELSPELKNQIFQQNDLFAQKSMRVLAFAYRIHNQSDENLHENDLIFVGLQALIDPPRPDVIESIKKTHRAGVRVIMITGDYPQTAQAIGQEIGIEGGVLTGIDLSNMSDLELENKLKEGYNIFARVIPEHKQRIVTILQKMNHIVAMTGDGVNDAPALKKSDIGVAVGSGTEVAKEAADLILLDDSFTHIVSAIEEGRAIYDNIQKAIMHSLSINFSEVFVIFVAVILGWNLPLTALMLLWINLVIDAVPALTLAFDAHGKDVMERKPKINNQQIFQKDELSFMIAMATFSSLCLTWLFYDLGGNSTDKQAVIIAQTSAFNFLVIASTIFLLEIRNFFGMRMFSNPWLWSLIIASFVLQATLLYSPLSQVFAVSPLDTNTYLKIFLLGGLLYVLTFLSRILIMRKYRKK